MKASDRKRVLEFTDKLTAEGLTGFRISKYAQILVKLAGMFRKPFDSATKEDILQVVKKLETSDYSEWTKHDYKIVLKRFYQWLRNTEDDYPPEVKWIKSTVKKSNHMLPEELLTPEEVAKLADAASNPRDKAFIQTIYESGCRIGELLTLKIKHVHFDEHGAILIVTGKTGMRRVRIIASTPALSQWIESHPEKDQPDSPLWIGLWTKNYGEPLNYDAVRVQLKKLAVKAGIKKDIHPHLFRHSRASHLANQITEAQMKEHFGWTQNSDMAATYVHLSGRNVDRALLKASGIEIGEEPEEEKFKLRICPRCKEKNSPGQRFCGRCGTFLTLKTAIEMQKVEESEKPENLKVKRFMVEQGEALALVLKDPEVQRLLVQKFAQLGLAVKT